MKKYICSNCGASTNYFYEKEIGCFNACFKTILKVILVIMLFTPAFLVSLAIIAIWFIIALTAGKNKTENICPHCKAENTLVPTSTLKGQELTQQYNIEEDEEVTTRELTQSEEMQNKGLMILIVFVITAFLILALIYAL